MAYFAPPVGAPASFRVRLQRGLLSRERPFWLALPEFSIASRVTDYRHLISFADFRLRLVSPADLPTIVT